MGAQREVAPDLLAALRSGETPERRQAARVLHEAGWPASDIARLGGFSRTLVKRWRDRGWVFLGRREGGRLGGQAAVALGLLTPRRTPTPKEDRARLRQVFGKREARRLLTALRGDGIRRVLASRDLVRALGWGGRAMAARLAGVAQSVISSWDRRGWRYMTAEERSAASMIGVRVRQAKAARRRGD